MIRILRNVLLVVVVTLITHGSYGQVTLGASPYVQNFNTIGSGLPVGWTVRTGSTASVLGTAASLATATTAWSNTAGNFRNVAAAGTLLFNSSTTDQNNASNRALAVRQTGAVGDPGGAFVLQIANTSGLSNFSLSFKLQSLDGSAAGRTTVWKVDYGFGALPTSFSTVTTNPASLSTTLAASGTSWGSTDVTVSLGTALDGRAENVWIRIVTLSASTGSGSRPTTGIDDFTLTYSASDVLPPAFALTYPQISAFLTDGFSVKSRISEEGKTYFAVLADGSAAPTSVQVKAGQDATGTPLASNFFGFVTNSTASAEAVAAIAGLSSATDYDVYVVAEDNFANLKVAPVKLDARTNTIG
jgi:trimeric autotransporter adhesin